MLKNDCSHCWYVKLNRDEALKMIFYSDSWRRSQPSDPREMKRTCLSHWVRDEVDLDTADFCLSKTVTTTTLIFSVRTIMGTTMMRCLFLPIELWLNVSFAPWSLRTSVEHANSIDVWTREASLYFSRSSILWTNLGLFRFASLQTTFSTYHHGYP